MENAGSCDELISFLANKSVIVVGNGKFRNMGQFIDSYDVVIRFNNYKILGHEEHVGTRTTIWARCNNSDVRPRPNPDFLYEFNPHAREPLRPMSSRPCFCGDKQAYDTIKIERPSTGIAVLNWLHFHGVPFETIGFDFFKSEHYFDKRKNNYHKPEWERREFDRVCRRQDAAASYVAEPTVNCHRRGPVSSLRTIMPCGDGNVGAKAKVYSCRVYGSCCSVVYKHKQIEKCCARCLHRNCEMESETAVLPDRTQLALQVEPGAIGVELGTATGAFSAKLISTGRFERFYSIDRWAGDRGHNRREMARARRTLKRFHASVILRASFDSAVTRFDDESVDFVYHDGYAHAGDTVAQTLRQWWPKVKRGGIFAGHDYSLNWPSTVRAVDEFFLEIGRPFCLTREEISSWWTRK